MPVMEPITIIATLGSLVKLSWELNRKLNKFTHTWKTTSGAILAINNEISDLTVVLDHARTAQLSVFRSDENSTFVPALQCQLEQAERLLLQLDDFIAKIEQEVGFKRKWKWLLKNPKVAEFQHGLRGVRERICELMTAYNVYVYCIISRWCESSSLMTDRPRQIRRQPHTARAQSNPYRCSRTKHAVSDDQSINGGPGYS